MVGEGVELDGNIYAYISLVTNFLRKLQCSWKDAPGKNFFVWSDACVDKWHVWAPSLCWSALWRLWSWPIWGEGDCAPSLAGISKQTDSPSLKLSLEATDEMAQIMRHIINHRQGAAGSVYMCYTHIYACTHTFCLSICGTHTACSKESGAEERHGSLRAKPEIITQAVFWFSSWLLGRLEYCYETRFTKD